MSAEPAEISRETLVVHGASRSDQRTGALVPPLVLSATFAHGNPEQLAYSRDRNPTWELLEVAVAQLEGARGAVAFASGMAGIAAALELLPVGAEVVVAQDAYTGTRELLSHLGATGRLRSRRVDATLPAALEEVGGAAMVWLESMGNPLLSIPDLRAWAAAAHRQGAILVVDNTLATPLLCRPLELGADLVAHSASKHLGGHSDLMLGVVAGLDLELLARLRQHRTRQGGCP
ncbi:MAG: PLP-dependent transferase, partial [Candidatus Dormibacteria bacterium]